MKRDPIPLTAAPATLQDVKDRIAGSSLPETRKRDLLSAVATFAKLTGRRPAEIPLDLADIRQTLDRMVPAQAKVSRKRWANLRSDLAAAIDASGLLPMLKTAGVELDEDWARLLQAVTDPRVRHGLSRFARWASLRRITPEAVDDAVIERFIGELTAASLIRNLGARHRSVALTWNILCARQPGSRLAPVAVPTSKLEPTRVPWEWLPASFRKEVDRHLAWCAMPDPLDEQARARALAPQTRRLRRDHIHSAVTAACAAGIDVERLTSLASLVEPDVFRALLRQCWVEDGRALSAYTHGVSGTLIAIASEWVKVSAEVIATLKQLRHKLGSLPSGLTEKNKALLRKFDDVRLCEMLVELPDRLWRQARRTLSGGSHHAATPGLELAQVHQDAPPRSCARTRSLRSRHHQRPTHRSRTETDGREQTNIRRPYPHGRRHPLPRRVDDRAARLHPAVATQEPRRARNRAALGPGG